MTDNEKRGAAKRFYQKWVNRGKEDEDDRSYWIDFLQDVMGVDHATDRIEFQKKVIGPDSNTKRIDAYIPETRVLIEQKSLNIDLSKPQQGHDGMTPYEQAKMYDNALPVSEKAKWIVLSNFAEIWVYDMDTRKPEPQKFTLDEIPSKYSLFEFLVNQKEQKINKELEVSEKAGRIVGLIYDALLKQYINPESKESLKSLNILCVRLVFCLYAEDAHIFGTSGHMFHDYMAQFDTKDMRKALIELFKVLDIPEDRRDPYDTSDLSKFPYVNGGLFANENIEIPNFTDEIKDILLEKASAGFDWSQISPTIFGAVFESTLNPETRRSGGMHYTSLENIHKVIDPLFLDEINRKFDSIFFDVSDDPSFTAEEKEVVKELEREESEARKDGDQRAIKEIARKITALKAKRTRKSNLNINQQLAALDRLQEEIAELKFLDPACGSGNFLTESYLSLRRIENRIIQERVNLQAMNSNSDGFGGQIAIGSVVDPIRVSISQFYGIEINDFAVTVAKTALWIAESQMMKETEDILLIHLDFLPLSTNAYIVEENALRMDWNDVVPKNQLNYIMGNPPFSAARRMEERKRDDVSLVAQEFPKNGELDYVSLWYIKAARYMQDTRMRAGFFSTSSITQGEQVTLLWRILFEKYNLDIFYAIRSFNWTSEVSDTAGVHCIIVLFSIGNLVEPKYIVEDETKKQASRINGYLMDAGNIWIEAQKTSICGAPKVSNGSKPLDNAICAFTPEEKAQFIKKEPKSEPYFYRYMGSKEFINNIERWFLIINRIPPNELSQMPHVIKKLDEIRAYRKSSNSAQTKKLAETPARFHFENMPRKDYLVIPQTSSGRRIYVPIGFLSPDVMVNNKLQVMEDGGLYEFGILSSSVHNAWLRTVAGRLRDDFTYSVSVVYNTFPWPKPTNEQRSRIESTAKGILDVRARFPQSSLADLYAANRMPYELQKAHAENDKAVLKAYGFPVKEMSEMDCVAALMKMYQKLTAESN